MSEEERYQEAALDGLVSCPGRASRWRLNFHWLSFFSLIKKKNRPSLLTPWLSIFTAVTHLQMSAVACVFKTSFEVVYFVVQRHFN